jgi:RecB family exonuclease
VTRQEWYERLHAAWPGAPARLSTIEREVLLAAAAREAASGGQAPPFALRPGLIAEMLAFYDTLLANRRTLDRLESFLVADLEPRVDIDRGAERLLRQTRFLVATYRGFQARQAAAGGVDEDGLRRALLESERLGPYGEMVVATLDRAADPASGLYPADFDLLARLPGLRAVTVVATARVLAAGFGERLRDAFPDLEEENWGTTASAPDLAAIPCLRYRDREEELRATALRFRDVVEAAEGAAPPRLALVFGRPLPYVYLARAAFAREGLDVTVSDSLPLAAEPFAALLEQVFQAALSRFGRAALVGLLRSPHLAIEVNGRAAGPATLGALERALLEAGYSGSAGRLDELASQWTGDLAHAARAATIVVAELFPLTIPAPLSEHVATVRAFLLAHERPVDASDPLAQRHLRARAAALSILEDVAGAARRFDDPPIPLETMAAQLRRWMEGQTFAPREHRAGSGAVHLLDRRAARFGVFEVVHLAGLVAGEWPEPPRHEILYPQFLLSQLGWPKGNESAAAARAEFEDLLQLARGDTSASTFLLEDDTLVEPSPLLDAMAPGSDASPTVEPTYSTSGDVGAGWQRIRADRTSPGDARYHGQAGEVGVGRLSVSAIDRYLDCPFKYFAANVLRLEEEPEGDPALAPKARGIFVHELFRAFFAAWQRQGEGVVSAASLPRARALFADVAEEQLRTLPPGQAAAERLRLLGSAAAAGLGEMVFEAEAASGAPVVERLLEYPFDGTFQLEADGAARRVRLRGKIDRVDLLADGTLRVIDYKTGRAPDAGRSIQLPAYLVCALQQLARERGASWQAGQALYVAFGEPEPVQWVVKPGGDHAEIGEALSRLFAALDGIAAGSFPPRPAARRLCASCGFRSVCRKDYVDAE